MDKAEPQKEHMWLQKLAGEWDFEAEMTMGPDQPPMTCTGTGSVRTIGGLWTLIEGEGEMPGGGAATSLFTLGYDPQKQRFVGSFLASMMTHLWLYDGTLDADGKTLTLDTEGPSFAQDGTMSKYQDLITIVSDDHWMLTSRAPNPDGTWTEFMNGHYRRKK